MPGKGKRVSGVTGSPVVFILFVVGHSWVICFFQLKKTDAKGGEYQ
jgi:hypothetical protein